MGDNGDTWLPISTMDDLLKRQNQAAGGGFDPEGLQGGDLNGGDGLQPKGPENDVGSGLELERGLERVAAQEAWLNEQASLPVENWLSSSRDNDFSTGSYRATKTTSELGEGQADRSLVVIDSRSDHWQKLSTDLPENADLLVLDENVSGTDQLKDLLDQNILSNPYTKIAIIAKEDADCVYFGSQELTFAGLSDEISVIRQSELLHADTSIRFFPAARQVEHSISVGGVSYDSSLEQYARGLIESSFDSATFFLAVESSFSPSKYVEVKNLARDFIDGVNSPTFGWADFEVASYRVNGAYLVGQNKILISEELKSNEQLLKKVLLEELGHWFDDSWDIKIQWVMRAICLHAKF